MDQITVTPFPSPTVTDDTLWLPPVGRFAGGVFQGFCFWAMNNEDNQSRDRDLRDRIVSLIQANQQARPKTVANEELQKLKAAAARLDQMLQSGADADRQALKNAAVRLDQLLTDIRKGKEVTLKRRGVGQKREE